MVKIDEVSSIVLYVLNQGYCWSRENFIHEALATGEDKPEGFK